MAEKSTRESGPSAVVAPSTSGDGSVDARVASLEAANQALRGQVRTLVRTEQRLHQHRERLEGQLASIAALNRFALSSTNAATPEEILERALVMLTSVFPYQRGVAYLTTPDRGGLTPVALWGVEGCEAHGVNLAEVEPVVLDKPLPGEPLAGHGATGPIRSQGHGALVWHAVGIFDDQGEDPYGALLVPLSAGRGTLGALALWRMDKAVAPTNPLPGPAQVPLLRLVAHHVTGALQNLSLRGRLAAIVRHLPDAVMVLRGGRVMEVNAAAVRLLGAPAEDCVDRLLTTMVGESDRSRLRAVLDEGRLSAPHHVGELRFGFSQDKLRVAETLAVPIEVEGGPALMLIAADLTEKRDMRNQLVQADRLASVGALAAGIAHEVNNPLTYLMLSVERITQHGADASTRRMAETALDGAQRIRDIVQQLKTFARDDRSVENVDVNRNLETVAAMAGNEVRYRATVARDFSPQAVALGNDGRLSQVFLNLVINAAQSMPEGAVADNELRLKTFVSGDEVVVEVGDTGCGIASADLEAIFEPFYSTKPRAQGTGLGLSICRTIVEEHGGTLAVRSIEGEGSTFVVRLPKGEPGKVRSLPSAPTESSQPRLRVLVVDDERDVLDVAEAALRAEHDVTALSTARCVMGDPDLERYDVLVCDVMMPAMGGGELHSWLEENHPALAARTLFMTGGAFTEHGREVLERSVHPILEKPFRREELLRAVANAARKSAELSDPSDPSDPSDG